MPARTTWALNHRVTESANLRVTGHGIGHYDEATSVSVGRNANSFDIPCSVIVSVPGQGSPETMVGERMPTTVDRRPGFRNGVGAEGSYLMWQQRGDEWTAVSCSSLDEAPLLDVIADAVVFRSSSIKLPFDIDALPEGYGIAQIVQDLSDRRTGVYFGVINPAFRHADSDLVICYEEGPELVHLRAAALSLRVGRRERHRTLSRPVRRGPDRFAEDLDDRSTWFAAERVFG